MAMRCSEQLNNIKWQHENKYAEIDWIWMKRKLQLEGINNRKSFTFMI